MGRGSDTQWDKQARKCLEAHTGLSQFQDIHLHLTWKSLFTRPGLPKQAAPPRNQRDFLSEREENHTLLTMLEISIHLVTGGLYFCFHAAESLASKQAGADGLCVLRQDTAPGADLCSRELPRKELVSGTA